MFTGIVEELGTVIELDINNNLDSDDGTDARLRVRAGTVIEGVRHGDSISVNGVCLTVAEHDPRSFTADVMPETLRRSALGRLTVGDPVNLERSVTPTGRLGGHLVQGHVDGVGQILARHPGSRWDDVRVSLPSGLDRYVVPKGSITVDGVSLTVTEVNPDDFSVSLIPTTLTLTTLGRKGIGDPVNLEVDVLAKYVEKLLAAHP